MYILVFLLFLNPPVCERDTEGFKNNNGYPPPTQLNSAPTGRPITTSPEFVASITTGVLV